ncbi:tRNA pseudouridine(55) synthase TruB [Reinekea forsetii]|jgi:tRNA pseudouridine55 synthase|uniref:tRNA pseudouridine synthase B n=1 Tax=Reinekea forsetii TaxID=1336806 RepID=A0A2K8KL56_9GAMM|nr:tRNA pseudouridine(55) synthase TruB [Reinekea forsetii]ATX75655.1 tRNA pseudouridine synthase B [Reinekea forsetii]
MARRRKGRPLNGVLLVDKPHGFSSNALLQKVRWLYQAQKAGHTGALDPLATGLLPICFGEATKFTQFLLDADKRYLTTGLLGIATDTLDAEGQIIATAAVPELSAADIEAVLRDRFVGPIEQIPPMYSALKRDGKKLYELARAGIEIELTARPVSIFENRLNAWASPDLSLEVKCSKGTYIRTLVADIGVALGTVAHVTALRRTEHGQFNIAQAISLDALIELQERGAIDEMDQLLISIDQLLIDLPVIQLTADRAKYFSNGNDVQTDHAPGQARVYGPDQDFLGVGQVSDVGRLQPERLIARADV